MNTNMSSRTSPSDSSFFVSIVGPKDESVSIDNE